MAIGYQACANPKFLLDLKDGEVAYDIRLNNVIKTRGDTKTYENLYNLFDAVIMAFAFAYFVFEGDQPFRKSLFGNTVQN